MREAVDWAQGGGLCLKAQGIKLSTMLGYHLVLDSGRAGILPATPFIHL